MSEIHYGVVRIGDGWSVVGPSLRTRSFATQAQAEVVARRFAGSVIGRSVLLHLQSEDGMLQPGARVEAAEAAEEAQA